VDGWVSGGLFQPGYDDWRCIATTVNRMPAAALYLRTPDNPEYRLFAIAVLHIVDGKSPSPRLRRHDKHGWACPRHSDQTSPIVDESSARAAVTESPRKNWPVLIASSVSVAPRRRGNVRVSTRFRFTSCPAR